jgi:hypothetical protein
MGRFCTACFHPDRASIDAALLRHVASYRTIAVQFGLSDTALKRHERTHLHHSFQQAKDAALLGDTASLMAALNRLNAHTQDVLNGATDSGDPKLRLAAIEQGRRLVETASKLTDVREFEERLHAVEQRGTQHATATPDTRPPAPADEPASARGS